MSKTILINDSVDFNTFRADGKFPDVVLKIGDKSFQCHRIILAGTMKYFQSIFAGNLAEVSKGEVSLKWPYPEDFELLLTYAYGGSVSVGPDNFYRLWKISHYFGLQKLEDSCINYIVQDETSLSPDSVMNIFTYASKIANLIVVDKLIEWMARNFLRLVKNDKFFYISASDLIKIFISPSFKKDPTRQFSSLIRWVKYHSEEEKKKFLSELMDTIDLKNIPNDWYVQVITVIAALPNVSENINEDEIILSAEMAMQISVLDMDLEKSDSASYLNKLFTSPSFKKDPTRQLSFLIHWAKYHSEEQRKKFLSKLISTIDLKNIPNDWYMQVITVFAALTNVSENNKEDEISSAETALQLSVLDMDLEESDLITEDEEKMKLPFGLFILQNETNTYTVQKFKLETENDFKPVHGSSIRNVRNCYPTYEVIQNLDCSCVCSGNIKFIILSSLSKHIPIYNGYGQCIFKFYAETNNLKPVYQRFGERFDLKSIADSRDRNFLTTTTYNNNIVVYNNIDFIVYNYIRNDCKRMNMENFEPTLSPNLLSWDNNSIYVIGGKYWPSVYPKNSKSQSTGNFEIVEKEGKLLQHYDVRQEKWIQLPQMKYARSRAASCVHNDNLYVSGGNYSTNFENYNMEYFDIRAGKWNEFKTSMPKSKQEHSLVFFDNRLWFFGGGIDVFYDSTWFSYDLGAHTWSNVLSLPTTERILDVVVEI